MSSFWRELFKLQGTWLHTSSAYHPESDGPTEHVNHCLETYLRCFACAKPRLWLKFLPWAEYWFNMTYNASTKHTPFYIVYGQHRPVLSRFQDVPSLDDEVTKQMQLHNHMLDELKEQLANAQQCMKQFADQWRCEVSFEPGDLVLLKLRPYRLKSLAKKRNEKLAPCYYGPFKIVEKIGTVAYRLLPLADARIHPVFHVITEELGLNLEKVDLDVLGTCKKVTISKDDTVILDGAGDKKAIEERCEQIRSAIELSTSDYDKEKLQERLAKLSGGVAVLKIGGASEAEVGEKKDRVTDALNATKAAVEEGIVPGGGVALLYASKELEELQTANFDQKIGVQIIQNALKTPVHTIASNAGVEGAVVVGKLLEQDNPDLGYDAAKGEYVDMVKAGIIDPLKVIRTALVDAASVSSLMTTTEAVVVELPKDDKDVPAMGGMDY
ncbi:Chaperonin CPN60-2 [Morus notabilis]|uniref:Chaperonin CPN60-2 n=1 Tax=Morus notabilis TaxID=981085 RepID=W9R5Z3_9ROSA|nr:Chaperonin CPN60-2 [Morus notabilis]